MKILITGGSSLLGKALVQTKPENYKVESTWYTNAVINYSNTKLLPIYRLNVTDKSQVRYIFDRAKPDVVIHCAAMGSVDYAEFNYQEVKNVNVIGTENILAAAKDHDAKMVFISTNAVFSGNNPPYSEKRTRSPINLYGKLKRDAENRVMDSKNWLVIRPFLLYGWPWSGGRTNWVTSIIDTVTAGISTLMVNDIVWQPTYVIDVAETIWKLLETNNEIYHIASSERVTLYNLALKVAKVFDLDISLIQPVPSSHFKSIAKRPKDTTYDLSKLSKLGIELSNIESGLEKMKASKKE